MISLVAPKPHSAMEHCQMFKPRRTSWLNPASEHLFDAGYRDLDYTYDPPRQDYEPGRLVRSPEERNFRVIGAVNQWLQPVPQKMSTTTSGAINRIFYHRRYDYNAVSGVFIWPNRDPIGEPGFEVLRNGKANVAIGGVNLYLFVKNNAENYFDPLGLDIWVVRDKSGLIRHREAVGNNADGTYWSSDFGPTSHNLIHQCNCQGRINFNPNQLVLVPTNLPSDYVIESHTVVDQGATDAARDYAKQRADSSDQPRYDCCGNNCIDWANGLANYAMGRQLREDLDKIKNVK
jgi:hypothetical protein